MADTNMAADTDMTDTNENPASPPDPAHDDTCHICKLLILDPVRTTCNHLMCHSCYTQWADTAPMQSGNNDDSNGGFEEVGLETEVTCSMCRTITTARPDPETKEMLMGKYPVLYDKRAREEAELKSGEGLEKFTVLVGNMHRLVEREGEVGGNKHDWTFFVRFSKPEIVSSVKMRLVSSLSPTPLIFRRPFHPFLSFPFWVGD